MSPDDGTSVPAGWAPDRLLSTSVARSISRAESRSLGRASASSSAADCGVRITLLACRFASRRSTVTRVSLGVAQAEHGRGICVSDASLDGTGCESQF
jgi:hypothetical protein